VLLKLEKFSLGVLASWTLDAHQALWLFFVVWSEHDSSQQFDPSAFFA
jgi:hypothetical protein